MGSGILTLPFVTKENGIIMFPVFIFINAMIFYYFEKILMWAAYKTSSNDYGTLVKKCFGKVNVRSIIINNI